MASLCAVLIDATSSIIQQNWRWSCSAPILHVIAKISKGEDRCRPLVFKALGRTRQPTEGLAGRPPAKKNNLSASLHDMIFQRL